MGVYPTEDQQFTSSMTHLSDSHSWNILNHVWNYNLRTYNPVLHGIRPRVAVAELSPKTNPLKPIFCRWSFQPLGAREAHAPIPCRRATAANPAATFRGTRAQAPPACCLVRLGFDTENLGGFPHHAGHHAGRLTECKLSKLIKAVSSQGPTHELASSSKSCVLCNNVMRSAWSSRLGLEDWFCFRLRHVVGFKSNSVWLSTRICSAAIWARRMAATSSNHDTSKDFYPSGLAFCTVNEIPPKFGIPVQSANNAYTITYNNIEITTQISCNISHSTLGCCPILVARGYTTLYNHLPPCELWQHLPLRIAAAGPAAFGFGAGRRGQPPQWPFQVI